MNFCKDPVVKLRSLLLTALMRVPSTASNSRPNRSRRRHRITNCRKTFFERGAIVAAEIGDSLEIRLQAAQQPDDLDVAMTFGLKTAARPNPVEIRRYRASGDRRARSRDGPSPSPRPARNRRLSNQAHRRR